MGSCQPVYGNITIFVAFDDNSYNKSYRVAQETIDCYVRGTNYSILKINVDNDERVKEKCSHHNMVWFKKHCAVATYLPDTNWMLVLDADTGVVNPNHCIEEWIDERVDILFYERFFNFEVAVGGYLIKNTAFAMDFVTKLADYEFDQPPNWLGSDNSALEIHILKTVLPNAKQAINICEALRHNATTYENYMAFVTCVKFALGARYTWPDKLRIFRRAHGFARDAQMTYEAWCENDFMFHGWKQQRVLSDSPFKTNIDPKECGTGLNGWNWRPEKMLNTSAIREMISVAEKFYQSVYPPEAKKIPFLEFSDVAECYPQCEDDFQ